MLTISQLAAHAGVTVAAVRHYHKIGLLPEPERTSSGYRNYDAQAVVRLIRVHVLTRAGVPLSQVEGLLDAEPERFATEVQQIDRRLRAQIKELEQTRQRLARLAAGEHLALPDSVVDYLDRLRVLGVDERYVEIERDAWIMVAAQVPDRIESIIAQKHQDLDDPDVVRLYALLSGVLDWSKDDLRLIEIADILDRLNIRAAEDGELDPGFDERFVELLDAAMATSAPVAQRLLELLEERGWRGWRRLERLEGKG